METNRVNDKLLEELHKEKIKEYIPVIAYVVIVIALGIVGNIMTVIFYGFKAKKTTNTVFISSLAAIDLTTCVVLSDEIIELYYNITLKNMVGCQIMYFINHWLVTSSVWILFIICIDRYRKVCKYSAWQFTMVSAKISIAIVIGVALVHAIPNSLMRDIVRVNVTNSLENTIQGYYCTQSEKPNLQTTITALHVLDVILVCVAFITFLVLYGLIGRTILISSRKTKTVITHSNMYHHNDIDSTSDSETTYTTVETVLKDKSNILKADRINTLDNKSNRTNNLDNEAGRTNTMENNPHNTKSTSTLTHEASTHSRIIQIEIKITCIMVAITIGYIVSFIPYFIVNLAVTPNIERSKELSAGIQLALRSFILNSAINPYIIGVFNPVFRQFVKSSFCRCFRK